MKTKLMGFHSMFTWGKRAGAGMRLWVTRSRPFNGRTAEHLNGMGHDVIATPLFKVRPVETPDLADQPDLIAFTSLNGILHHPFRREWAEVPVVAGGDATAAAARRCGYVNVQSAQGGVEELQALAARSARPGARLVHFSAREAAGNLTAYLRCRGYQAVRKIVYEVEPEPVHDMRRLLLAQYPVDGILVHSRKGARRVADLVTEASWRGMVFCLSKSCAEEFRGIRGLSIEKARKPTDLSLMDVVRHAMADHSDDLESLRRRGLKIIGEIARARRLTTPTDSTDPESTPS